MLGKMIRFLVICLVLPANEDYSISFENSLNAIVNGVKDKIDHILMKYTPSYSLNLVNNAENMRLTTENSPRYSDPAVLNQLKGKFTTQYSGRVGLVGSYRKLAFFDDFKTLSIGNDDDPIGDHKWFSPGHTPYGFAKFPRITEFPDSFSSIGGALRLSLQKSEKGWYGADITTINGNGEGFTFTNGYTEAKIKAAQKIGGWSAFWMTSIESTTTGMHAEIDILESYGSAAYGYNSSIHLWPGSNPPINASQKHWAFGVYPKIPVAADDKFHVYGCELTDDLIIFYIDGKETARVPRIAEWKDGPWRIFLTLAGGPKEYASKAFSPNEMIVDYVKVWTN